jgi:hypothetical protein
MNGFGELQDFEKALGRLEKGLSGGDDWLRERAPVYRDVAERIGVSVLNGLRPPEEDPAEWAERVREFAEFLSWRGVTSGFEISYRKYQERLESGETPDIRQRDVLEWVRAGAEAGGKDKSESEVAAGKTDEEIAYVVTKAINQYRFGFAQNADYSAITERLEVWVKQKFLSADLSEALAAVLAAWVAEIAPMIEADFDAWVDAEIERAMA